jgi:hypothetical protein
MSFQTYVNSCPTVATAFAMGITLLVLIGVEEENLDTAYTFRSIFLMHFSPETRGICGAGDTLQITLLRLRGVLIVAKRH